MTYVGDYQSTDGSGTVAFLFSVRYIAVAAAATAGSVAATLTFDINYK
jgi:type 1 fimbria pilin